MVIKKTTRKKKKFNENNVKIAKRVHAFKSFVSSYTIKLLNYFNPELQLNDTKYAIKSKLINLMNQVKGFKFETTLV